MFKRLLLIVIVVALANGGALATIVANRRGAPDASLELTEREMRLTNMGTDTTGMTLTLQWDREAPTWWFDRTKLASIGFDCSMPPEAPGALDRYSGPGLLPRSTYVAFEYGADDSAAIAEQSTRGAARKGPEYRSRLKPVDAGNDPRALRARYPDRHRYLITAGTVGANFIRGGPNQPARLQGTVLWVDPIQLYVPQEMQAAIVASVGKGLRAQSVLRVLPHPPRYQVTVEYGSRLLPSIVGITVLAGK